MKKDIQKATKNKQQKAMNNNNFKYYNEINE